MDKKYLATHRIPELINKVVIDLVDTLPANPKEFLANAILNFGISDEEFDSGYPAFTPAHANNLLAKFLTPQMYDLLRHRRTQSGFTLTPLAQPGVDCPQGVYSSSSSSSSSSSYSSSASAVVNTADVVDWLPETPSVGVVAGDEETYVTFENLLKPIIAAYHHVDMGSLKDFASDWGCGKLGNVGASLSTETYVISCRVSASRNVRGFPLLPHIRRSQRRQVEAILARAVRGELPRVNAAEWEGQYHPCVSLPEDLARLAGKGLVCERPAHAEMVSGQVLRDWPDARGVFANAARTLAVWVNVTDHAKVVVQHRGADLIKVFEEFCDAVQAFEAAVMMEGHGLMVHPKLGYLTTSPENVGTACRVSVRVKLENLARNVGFSDALQKLHLQAYRVPGYDRGVVFDISNVKKLGVTEVKIVESVAKGVTALVDLEKKLESGFSLDEEDTQKLSRLGQSFV